METSVFNLLEQVAAQVQLILSGLLDQPTQIPFVLITTVIVSRQDFHCDEVGNSGNRSHPCWKDLQRLGSGNDLIFNSAWSKEQVDYGLKLPKPDSGGSQTRKSLGRKSPPAIVVAAIQPTLEQFADGFRGSLGVFTAQVQTLTLCCPFRLNRATLSLQESERA